MTNFRRVWFANVNCFFRYWRGGKRWDNYWTSRPYSVIFVWFYSTFPGPWVFIVMVFSLGSRFLLLGFNFSFCFYFFLCVLFYWTSLNGWRVSIYSCVMQLHGQLHILRVSSLYLDKLKSRDHLVCDSRYFEC
jgi:hypothetical protein